MDTLTESASPPAAPSLDEQLEAADKLFQALVDPKERAAFFKANPVLARRYSAANFSE